MTATVYDDGMRPPGRPIEHLIRCRACGNRDLFNVTTTMEVTVYRRGRGGQAFGPFRQTGSRWVECSRCGSHWSTDQKVETRDGWRAFMVWSTVFAVSVVTVAAAVTALVSFARWVM